jgi:hypothetical protein
MAREMWEADKGISFPFDEVAPHRLNDAYRQADIALRHIKEAYKQGCNDRENDFMETRSQHGIGGQMTDRDALGPSA